MAMQEFLASYAVKVDEDGARRLQAILERNRESGAALASVFSSARSALAALKKELSEYELESLMKTCLRSVSVLLPAGPMKVMDEGGNWGYPELEYDSWNCLKLTMEVIQWTLEGFFGDGASGSQPATPDS